MSLRLKEMVERISWFKDGVDYEILLFYESYDIGATAKVVAYNIDYGQNYVNARMKMMERAGLFSNEEGVYELTDLGREFLAGDVGEDELPEP
ncbi:MarR family transcriptional regulator [Haloferax sp. Atlit-12N]|uniref:MarR family transcriptional regulator n=1 Tax=Haloferax sp. Atlit-12N TaxID=2077203 RepID=UPI001F19CDE0|nr:MarR family transcriptional regulator [Haloferax sp. Atlit-12N]